MFELLTTALLTASLGVSNVRINDVKPSESITFENNILEESSS